MKATHDEEDGLAAALQRLSAQIIDGVEQRLAGRFQQIDDRFQQVDDRFGQVDERLSALEQAHRDLEVSTERGFNRLSGEIESLRGLFVAKEQQATAKKKAPRPRKAA